MTCPLRRSEPSSSDLDEADIYVDNDPAKEFAGIDDQLNEGIEMMLEGLKTKSRKLSPILPYPIKN